MSTEYEIKQYNDITVEVALDGRNYVQIKQLPVPPRAEPVSALACFSGMYLRID